MARKKLFGNHRSASCDVCEFGQLSSDNNAVLCARLGVVPRYHHCRRFRYDPLKRIPPRQKPLQQFDTADFSLEELALDEPLTAEVPDTPASLAAKQADLPIPAETVEPAAEEPVAEDPPATEAPAADEQSVAEIPAVPEPATDTPPVTEDQPAAKNISDTNQSEAAAPAVAEESLFDAALLEATGLSPETLAELQSCLENQRAPSAHRILKLLTALTATPDSEAAPSEEPEETPADERAPFRPVSRNVAMAALQPETDIRLLDEDAEYDEDNSIDEATVTRLSGHPVDLDPLVLLSDAQEDDDPEQDLLAKDLIFMSEASLKDADENKLLIMTEKGPAVKSAPLKK